MVLEKFNPKNLKNLYPQDFEELTKEDISNLAAEYPHMKADLRIKKADGTGVEAPATFRSLNSLLRSGHKFKISGTSFGIPKQPLPDIEAEVSKLDKPDFIALQHDIFKPKINKNEHRKTTKRVRNK